MGFLVEGIPVLSKGAREFVVQHPREGAPRRGRRA